MKTGRASGDLLSTIGAADYNLMFVGFYLSSVTNRHNAG
jgi:hypothetical protein